jgi:GWxTD domain-containing protein
MMDILTILRTTYAEAAALSLLHFIWEGAIIAAAAAWTLHAFNKSSARTGYSLACVFLVAMAASPVATYLILTSGSTPAAPATAKSVIAPFAATSLESFTVQQRTWLQAVLACWLAGVVVFALRAAGGWLLALKELSRDRKTPTGHVLDLVSDLSARIGIRRAVRIFESTRAAVPVVFGAMRPVILLPASAVTGLPPAQLEGIIAHELAHVARHDFLVNCLQIAVEVLLFFHPAVWWLSRRIRQEREMCCDAIAANICGDRVLYSRALLALEEGRQEFALAATGGDLKARIEHLLGTPAKRDRVSASPLLVLALLLVVSTAYTVVRGQSSDTPYDSWIKQDVVYIISEEERQAWDRLRTDEERQQFITQFWATRDPVSATRENEFKDEHYRRIGYTNGRFGDTRPGWATARGRIYIVKGPPDEIESHPREYREEWRYLDGSHFTFAGASYELISQRAADWGPGQRLIERIGTERLPEPQRTQLRNRLAEFVGQPMSNELMGRIRRAAREVDPTLTFHWHLDPTTKHASLDLSYNKL